ncbi:O-linked N-acetylglucosamine transferase family protein [Magnetococcus sp. PR-3]|uniref:O-linked N-acetylglucosamine transferase family protein n=1 Tax=Magnetococcus sp. PR-3 TaxID=3120355 RepID=UPI002FCE2E2D
MTEKTIDESYPELEAALRCMAKGDLNQLASLIKPLMIEPPEDPYFLGHLAVMLRRLKSNRVALGVLRQVTKQWPELFVWHYNLGNSAKEAGLLEEAETAFHRALQLHPSLEGARFNLAQVQILRGAYAKALEHLNVLQKQDKPSEQLWAALASCYEGLQQWQAALEAIDQALFVASNRVRYQHLKTSLLLRLGRSVDAWKLLLQGERYHLLTFNQWVALFRSVHKAVLKQQLFDHMRQEPPDSINPWMVYGSALQLEGKYEEALTLLQQAEHEGVMDAALWDIKGVAFQALGAWPEALTAFETSLKLNPNRAAVYANYGMLHQIMGDTKQAETAFRQAISLKPDFAMVCANLGLTLSQQFRLEESVHWCRHALALNDKLPQAHIHLGLALIKQGKCSEGSDAMAVGLALNPSALGAYSSYLLGLNYQDIDPYTLFYHHLGFGAEVKKRFIAQKQWSNTADPERDIRVGWVLSSVEQQGMNEMLRAVLGGLRGWGLEHYLYDNADKDIAKTEGLYVQADEVVSCRHLSHEALAQRIGGDGVDILIDVGGHASHNRLPVFALKPAPVQLCWAGYANTRGLESIDGIVLDELTAPEASEPFYSEPVLRLPHVAYCYEPDQPWLPLTPLPARLKGYVTFGCFNDMGAWSPRSLRLWAEILKKMPESRLALRAASLQDRSTLDRVVRQFAQLGIGRDRVQFFKHEQDASSGEDYQHIDLALDTLPCNGIITTLQGLWQGVPMVTRLGVGHRDRVGGSIMTDVEMTSWIADSDQAYIDCAVAKAQNLDALAAVRDGLRDKLSQSHVGSALRFSPAFEALLRKTWRRWCA